MNVGKAHAEVSDYGTNIIEQYSSSNNDYYKTEYQLDDYKKFSAYEKDSINKKDNTIVKKINCINININNNGDNNGDINVGNRGLPTEKTTTDIQGLTANIIGVNNGGERYNDGYQKNNKDALCIINNNNNNENVVGDGESPTVPVTCKECFEEHLTIVQLIGLDDILGEGDIKIDNVIINNLDELCAALAGKSIFTVDLILQPILTRVFVDATSETYDNLLRCLVEALSIELPF